MIPVSQVIFFYSLLDDLAISRSVFCYFHDVSQYDRAFQNGWWLTYKLHKLSMPWLTQGKSNYKNEQEKNQLNLHIWLAREATSKVTGRQTEWTLFIVDGMTWMCVSTCVHRMNGCVLLLVMSAALYIWENVRLGLAISSLEPWWQGLYTHDDLTELVDTCEPSWKDITQQSKKNVWPIQKMSNFTCFIIKISSSCWSRSLLCVMR